MIEEMGIHNGLPWVTRLDEGFGHRCGYVGLPQGHPSYGKRYEDIDVEVHGGLTFSGWDVEGFTADQLWWVGFDCLHAGDAPDPELAPDTWRSSLIHGAHVWTSDEVVQETERLAEQLAEVGQCQ